MINTANARERLFKIEMQHFNKIFLKTDVIQKLKNTAQKYWLNLKSGVINKLLLQFVISLILRKLH